MTHRVLTQSEKTVADLGVEVGKPYTVEGEPRHDGLSQIGLEIRYKVGDDMRSFGLGLHADTQNFFPGDTLEFQARILPLRLSNEKMAELGVTIGEKLVVQVGEDSRPGPDSGPYIEVSGQKIYLWNFGDNFNSRVSETGVGETLTILGQWDKIEDVPK